MMMMMIMIMMIMMMIILFLTSVLPSGPRDCVVCARVCACVYSFENEVETDFEVAETDVIQDAGIHTRTHTHTYIAAMCCCVCCCVWCAVMHAQDACSMGVVDKCALFRPLLLSAHFSVRNHVRVCR